MGKAKTAEPVPDMNDVRIYLGPTMHRRAMVHGACFRGGLSAAVQRVIANCPEVGKMIFPVEAAAEATRKIAEQGTESHRLSEYLRGVRFNADGRVREEAQA